METYKYFFIASLERGLLICNKEFLYFHRVGGCMGEVKWTEIKYFKGVNIIEELSKYLNVIK